MTREGRSLRPSPRLSLPWPRLWAGIVLFWLAVGAFTALQRASAGALLGGGGAPPAPSFPGALLSAAAWIPFTGGIVWLAWRAPVTRETWTWALPLHTLGALITAFGVNLTMAALQELAGAAPVGGPSVGAASAEAASGAVGVAGGVVRTALVGAARWLHVLALVYGAIVLSVQASLGVLRARRRERDLTRTRAELAEARLEALRAQLRPHFLFNALHTLGMLWRVGRDREAQRTLDRLSLSLRRVLESGRKEEVSLEDELELAESYLAVERARFGDRLHVAVDVPEGLRRMTIPPLVLQPLVENAVRHGVEGRTGAGRIRIEARREGDDLVLAVRDDGPGPPTASASAKGARAERSDPDPEGTGVGLSNLRERLRHRYGAGAHVELSEDPGGRGTVAEVRIPAISAVAGGSFQDPDASGG